jgi:ribonucleoside-diphosphate reductase alpha chain
MIGKLSDNALTVLERRYLEKDEAGNPIETPEQMFRRVAGAVARAERKHGASQAQTEQIEERFYRMMSDLEFLPNSPTLMNAGRELGQLSACFVLPIEDSMGSIFEAVKNTALIHQSGGGTGFSFSRLRPAGDLVKSTMGVSSGPISFMEVFNGATEAIKQGGTRRGANMGILRVDHPDILDFIRCKEDNARLTNFNISVAVTEEFMEAALADEEYDLVNPRNGEKVRRLRAKEVFEMIVEGAWRNGEPGIVFLDRINRDNPTPELGMVESTNPCGEQPLLPYESCNLGSINVGKFVTTDNGRRVVDYEGLRRITADAIRFLDNVIDVNQYPLPQIEEMTKANRKIGLGLMGFADLLTKLWIPYNSQEALDVADSVMSTIAREAKDTSATLAEQRGVFSNWEKSVYAGPEGRKMRNATLTTIAPTGTLSIIANCSSGIEPLFAISFVRRVLDGAELVEVNEEFKRVAQERGFASPELMRKVADLGSIVDIAEIPQDVRRVFVTAHDISPEWHIKMQAAFQKHVDNAVSKTVNFPNHATPKDVADVFIFAYRSGCKGVTVYRSGSREEQVLTAGTGTGSASGAESRGPEAADLASSVHSGPVPPNGSLAAPPPGIDGKTTPRAGQPEPRVSDSHEWRKPRPRPKQTTGVTQKVKTGCGNLYVTLNQDDCGLCEVFTQMGKSGGCAAAQSEAVARMISLALRSGIDPEEIVEQLRGIRCPAPGWDSGGTILSCPDGTGKAIEGYLKQNGRFEKAGAAAASGRNAAQTGLCPECPDCGAMLEMEGGCVVCRSCGYSKC